MKTHVFSTWWVHCQARIGRGQLLPKGMSKYISKTCWNMTLLKACTGRHALTLLGGVSYVRDGLEETYIYNWEGRGGALEKKNTAERLRQAHGRGKECKKISRSRRLAEGECSKGAMTPPPIRHLLRSLPRKNSLWEHGSMDQFFFSERALEHAVSTVDRQP